jgi:acyl-CoA thioester hydrolase
MTLVHRVTVRVYYEDTDFSGSVYHAAYLHFFERARTEFLRERGVHHSELVKDGIAFAVRSMRLEFERAAHIDDLLEIETRLVDLGGARLELTQEIRRGGTTLTRAEVTVVAIRGGRAIRLPRDVAGRLTKGGP